MRVARCSNNFGITYVYVYTTPTRRERRRFGLDFFRNFFYARQRILDERVAGRGGDTAVVLLVTGHLDVTLVTPGLAPAVLHEPVVLAVIGRAVANDEDTVVEFSGGAFRLIVDTWKNHYF